MHSLVKRRAAAVAVAISAIAVSVPAATATAAGPRDLSPAEACPAWYGDTNLIIGCTPRAVTWLAAHQVLGPQAAGQGS